MNLINLTGYNNPNLFLVVSKFLS